MWFAELLFIFLFTLLLVYLLVPVGRFTTYRTRLYGRRARVTEEEDEPHPEVGVGMTMLFFFLILFPLILAGSFWVTPFGPLVWGIAWVPIVAIGLILALLIAAVSPRGRRHVSVRPARPGEEAEEEEEGAALFGVFFFLLLVVAIVAVAAALL